jgi:hypothetical protein
MIRDWTIAEPDVCTVDLAFQLLRHPRILWERFEACSFFYDLIGPLLGCVGHVPASYLRNCSNGDENSIVTFHHTHWHEYLSRWSDEWPVYHTVHSPCKLCASANTKGFDWDSHSLYDILGMQYSTLFEYKSSPFAVAFDRARTVRRKTFRGVFFAAIRLVGALRRYRWWRPGGKLTLVLATSWTSRCLLNDRRVNPVE